MRHISFVLPICNLDVPMQPVPVKKWRAPTRLLLTPPWPATTLHQLQNLCALHIASGFAPPWLGQDIEGAAARHTASGLATPSCSKSPWELQKGAHRIYFCFHILTVRCSDALFVHHIIILCFWTFSPCIPSNATLGLFNILL